MEKFEKKSLKTARGHTYTYYVSGGDRSLPPLLFLHGWPDHAQMWDGVVAGLTQRGNKFPVIVPDLLGYDGTSKPTDPAEYSYKGVVGDVFDIVDAEGFGKVVSIGHDWGSAVAQRVYNYHPERVEALVLLNVAYVPPSRDKLDLDAFNGLLTQLVGYPCFSYWSFFTDPDAPQLLKDNVDKVYAGIYAANKDFFKEIFCSQGGFRKYLTDTTVSESHEIKEYARDPEFKKAFIDRMQRDGFEAPQNWYHAARYNHHWECDSKLPQDRAVVKVPTLYIGSTDDVVCVPQLMIPAKQAGVLPDLEEVIVETAHWSPYEKPDEVAQIIADYLERKVLTK